MKLKIKISIILMCFLLIVISSCARSKIHIYEKDEARDFIDEIYNYIEKEKDYTLIDIRNIEEYAKGHFFGFTNYDIEKGNIEELLYKIESMHSKEKAIFLIYEDESYLEDIANKLKEKKYKKIYIYLGGYQELCKNNNDDFEIKTGTEDCEC